MRRAVVIIILLAVVLGSSVAVIVYHNNKMQNASNHLDPFLHAANGVSLNLKDFLEGSEDVREAALIGAKLYFDDLNQALDAVCAYGDEPDLFSNLTAALNLAHIRFISIFRAYLTNKTLSNMEDHAFLTGLKSSLDTMINSMRNENGTLKSAVLTPDYFMERTKEFVLSLRQCL